MSLGATMSGERAERAQRARVVRAWDETPEMRALVLAAPALAPLHLRPGQYVRAVSGGVEGFFALANAPGEAELQLLVKRGAAMPDRVAALGVGDELELFAPSGAGFPLETHRGQDLLLFAAGSGIAPIRSVIRQLLAQRTAFGRVRLYYGHRRADDFAYLAEHGAWLQGGVDIVQVTSATDASWPGARGWVQDVLRRDPPHLAAAVAYLAGMTPMIEGVTRTLEELGLERERIFLNY
jgi:sulfhydrogenase subunit gamma (sulfur reductase)